MLGQQHLFFLTSYLELELELPTNELFPFCDARLPFAILLSFRVTSAISFCLTSAISICLFVSPLSFPFVF